ncbi:MAG: hypothetical protein ABL931_14470 [Usitatibacteraceae bacterium]
MSTRLVTVLLALSALYGGCELWSERAVKQAPGILAPTEPTQRMLDRAPPLEKSRYSIRPLAQYDIRARVLSKERYRWDEGADLVPVDLAIGWGPMSNTAVLKELDISQSTRWYQWRTETFPIPREDVTRFSANMHLIAADKGIEKKISRVRSGQVVSMKGYLVEAKRPDGFTWTSSLTRTDTGNGACELMWVTDFDVEY